MLRGPIRSWGAVAASVLLAGALPSPAEAAEPAGLFVRRDGDVLKEGDREFRFISFNIPNLHYVEDDMRFDRGMPFRLPDDFEIDDALGTIAQMGGQVVRTYTLSVKKADDPPDLPRYILGPGRFNEEAFAVLDRVVAAAARHRVRLIIPFVDQWSWWGGLAELAAFRGKKLEDCWTDPVLIDDFKAIVAHLVERKNTVTGIAYRDDPTILAWETGNELHGTPAWTRTIAAHIKALDPRHLVVDGAHRRTLLEESITDPSIDLVGTHHYEKDAREMIANIRESAKMARGRKPYHVGEFGFLGTESLRAVMDAVLEEKLAGALLWSLRYRAREGGFYWHHEPAGGDRFKAYHWPGSEIGESYDERRLMRIVREKAFEIRGLELPPLPAPASPRLLSVGAGSLVTWQGSVGAWGYDVERSDSAGGPWTAAGLKVSEAQVQYRPLFADESARPGRSFFYRVIARNPAGASPPSNVVGPVRIAHRTLVDEFWNDSRILAREGKTAFHENEARKFKEDCHRLSGEKGSAIIYRGRGGIRAVRAFVFSPKGDPGIRLAFSADGRKFEPVEATVARTITHGEDAYGFWKALLITAAPAAGAPEFVRIEFVSEAQLSRVEIDHDAADR
jgi:mannan endo-1,4-beta-mannosidase